MHHQRVPPLHMDRQAKAKEAVLEFRDNPPSSFQRAVNLVFIGSSQGPLLQRINIKHRRHKFIMCGRLQDE